MSRVSCSDESFIKRLIYKKRKERSKEVAYSLYYLGLHYNESFYFEATWSNMVHTIFQLQTTQRRYDGDQE